MSRIMIWFDENKLTLNLSKTKCIILGNRLTDTNKKLMINGIELEQESEIKFLGVVIDSKLSWKPHIKYIKTKISTIESGFSRYAVLLIYTPIHDLLCRRMGEHLQNKYKPNLHPTKKTTHSHPKASPLTMLQYLTF